MSLLSNASTWIPLDDGKDKNSKKKPAMLQTYQRLTTPEDINKFDLPNVTSFSNDTQNSENQERVQRIESILQKMNQIDSSPELTNYTPPPLSLQELSVPSTKETFSSETAGQIQSYQNQSLHNQLSFSDHPNQKAHSSYQRVYNSPVPYFEPPMDHNTKLMEKLNYMIHLLEQQQHESTQYIWEEFLLYGLLGVFMIYLVDSFARAGKYIR